METKNTVYIASSLDGYIADKEGGLDWLHSVPNPDQSDMGFTDFMASIDAIIMGRNTFETVCGFDMDWPYSKPVFVLSKSLKSISDKFAAHAALIKGELKEVLKELHEKGFRSLYIDGGKTIQSFLAEDLIDELIISKMPVILGGGAPLFSDLPQLQEFEHIETKVLLGQIVQSHYKRKK